MKMKTKSNITPIDYTDSDSSVYSGLDESDTSSESDASSESETDSKKINQVKKVANGKKRNLKLKNSSQVHKNSKQSDITLKQLNNRENEEASGGDNSNQREITLKKLNNRENEEGASNDDKSKQSTLKQLNNRENEEAASDDEVSLSEFFGAPEPIKVEENANEKEVKPIVDEYAQDTSDEEDIRNTVGNIPMQWYDEFEHIGYDVEGRKIIKPATDDEIDEFLNKMDDPNYWITVKNKMTGEKVVLSDEDLSLIRRIQSGKYPTAENLYPIFEDLYSHEVMEHPVTNIPPHKRSFIPSKIEKEKVSKLVYAIKMGWIKPRPPKPKSDEFYLLWDDNEKVEPLRRMQNYIPPPKRKLPGHEESYNPPPEYLFTEEEEEKWKEEEPEERKLDFIPKKFSSLRVVPAYSEYVRDWFNRCLDLYLCPRKRKMRVNVDPNALIPELPKPKDLQPFPTLLSVVYTGHTSLVRCICVEPTGQFMASSSDDCTIKVWEVLTGRCLVTIDVESTVKSLNWCPNTAFALLLAAVDDKVYIINPKVGDKLVVSSTDLLLSTMPENRDASVVVWSLPDEQQKRSGIRIVIQHTKEVKQVTFHAKGDYFACLVSDIGYKSIVIHQLSKYRSQVPFQKLKGNIQKVMFHPLRPLFFVATHKHVRIYNLLKQEISKVVYSNCQWISSMAIHPQGDNLLLGSYDCKLSWFDLELSSKPYKTLKHHQKAIRQVAYHSRYPLFASASDDGNVIICHGMVYSDLLQNPLIIPVKILKGHGRALDLCFHPQRPWIFSSSDNTIRLYS